MLSLIDRPMLSLMANSYAVSHYIPMLSLITIPYAVSHVKWHAVSLQKRQHLENQ